MTREGSAARYPPGNGVPSAIGTSPKMVPGSAPAERALDPVDRLDDLDLAGENGEERALSALVNGEFSGSEMDVGGRVGETLQVGGGKRRKQRDRRDIVNGQHGCPLVSANSIRGIATNANGAPRGAPCPLEIEPAAFHPC